jgi:hypothetical protein
MSLVLQPPPPRDARRPGGRPWRAPLLATALVLLAHAAWVLQPAGPGPGPGMAASGVMRVRQITAPPPPRGAAAVAAANPAPPPAVPLPRRPGFGAADHSAARPAPALQPTQALAVNAETQPATGGPPSEAPVYATRPPPTTTLRYTLQRGAQQGHAELQWQVDDGRYSLSLRSEVNSPVGTPGKGSTGPGSASVGRLDANGLAPDRHTESRRGRELRAVNFQRDTARVTFSGTRGELPLQAGAQDRLSWLLQLAAIAEANPALRAAGQALRVEVIGTRGDAEIWVFTVLGREDLSLPVGAAPDTLHLRREAQRPYDTHADVWLDPTRQHLPVRVQLRLRATGEGSEWQLQAQTGP